MANKPKNKNKVGKAVAIGASVVALSAAAYLLLGPDGKKNRQKVATWAGHMRKEAAQKLTQLKKVSKPVYEKMLNDLKAKYSKQYQAEKAEVEDEIKRLKGQWKQISSNVTKKAKGTIAKAKKTVRKAVSGKSGKKA